MDDDFELRKLWTDEQSAVYGEAALFVYRYDQSDEPLSDGLLYESMSEETKAYAQASAQQRKASAAKVFMDELFEYGVLRFDDDSREIALSMIGQLLVQDYLRRDGPSE